MAGNSFSSVNISQWVWLFPLVFLFFQDIAQEYLMKNTKTSRKSQNVNKKNPTQRLNYLFDILRLERDLILTRRSPSWIARPPSLRIYSSCAKPWWTLQHKECSAHPTPPHQLQPRWGERKEGKPFGVLGQDYNITKELWFPWSRFSAVASAVYRDGSKQKTLLEACPKPWIPLPT